MGLTLSSGIVQPLHLLFSSVLIFRGAGKSVFNAKTFQLATSMLNIKTFMFKILQYSFLLNDFDPTTLLKCSRVMMSQDVTFVTTVLLCIFL